MILILLALLIASPVYSQTCGAIVSSSTGTIDQDAWDGECLKVPDHIWASWQTNRDGNTVKILRPTDAEWASFLSAFQLQKANAIHSQAVASSVSGPDPVSTLERAAALVIMDELNILRQREMDIASDVAAATSLADLKTRWAARPALTQRNASQIQAAIQAKINAGAAD